MICTKFVCATEEYGGIENPIPAPLFRGVFCGEQSKKYTLTICGLGFYELFINGQKITRSKLAPYISNPDDLLYYDTYDVSQYVQKGENVIGVMLGNGFLNNYTSVWGFDKAKFRSAPKFAICVQENDSVILDATAFKTAQSPIIFNDLRIGEWYDARKEKEIENWSCVGYDDSKWHKVKKAKIPLGRAVLSDVTPIVETERKKAQQIIYSDGGYLFDFGESISGVAELKIRGECAQKIRIEYGEALFEGQILYKKNIVCALENKDLWHTDYYTCKGEGVETYKSYFTYHGFRYVYVEGIQREQLTDDLLTAVVYRADFGSSNTFWCDNQVVNTLQEMTVRSDYCNFIHIPTDCPHREKNGWTADIAISCEQFLYNFDCSKELEEWLKNVRFAQREDGAFPGIVPTAGWGFEWGNGPAWDYVIVELPYVIYRFSGNEQILKDNAEAIYRYVRYLKTKINNNGGIAFGLGDWCDCNAAYNVAYTTPLEITDMLMAIEICQKASFIFEKIQEKEKSAECLLLERQIKQSFKDLHVKGCAVDAPTQTAQAKAIDVGIFEGEEKRKAIKELVERIHRDNDTFRVGVIGARVLFRVLCEGGYQDLALKLITQDAYPSYYYWIKLGYSTLGESFWERRENSLLRKDGGEFGSMNHHFWGDISAVFYKYILGLQVNPNMDDPNRIVINPKKFAGVNKVKGVYKRNGKELEIAISYMGDTVKVDILKNTGFNVEIVHS